VMNPVLSLALTPVLAFTVLAQSAQNVVPPTAVQNTAPADQAAGKAGVARLDLPETATPPARLKIILLKPTILIEDVPSGVRSDLGIKTPARNKPRNALGSEEGYEHLLFNAAKSGVGSRTLTFEPDTLEPSALEVCSKLEPLSSRLARGNVNDEAARALTSLAVLDENYAVLVQFLRLETGPGRSWDPNTGAITSSTNSTLIQAALVSSKTGKVIWKGERLIRNKALKPTDAGLSKALTELYRDFAVK